MKLEPTVNYLELTDDELAQLGLDAAKEHFTYLCGKGRVTNDSLHARYGMSAEFIEDGRIDPDIVEIAEKDIGLDGHTFAVNTGMDGKLGTVAKYDCDSNDATIDFGLEAVADGDPGDPRGWTGGAFLLARIKLDGVTYARKFGMACSGVQGSHDLICARTGAQDAAGAWMERVKARHAAGLSPILTPNTGGDGFPGPESAVRSQLL